MLAHLKDKMLILGIETSCDETAASVVKAGSQILSNVVASQVALHSLFGGVVPEIASRKQLEAILPVVQAALAQAKVKPQELTAVAVTCGPGLIGALLIGIGCAKAIAFRFNLPLVGVNHLAGHIYANFLVAADRIKLPAVCLIASGGHTELVYMPEHNKYEVLGRTLDDAAGEAFDKLARAMELGFPGGPIIEKLAASGKPSSIRLPKALYHKPLDFNFSFSGLKTAAIRYLNSHKDKVNLSDFAASIQCAVIDVLVEKTINAAIYKKVVTIMVGGGVACNSYLRSCLEEQACKQRLSLYIPPAYLCVDNAAMVACAGYYKIIKSQQTDDLKLEAISNLQLC